MSLQLQQLVSPGLEIGHERPASSRMQAFAAMAFGIVLAGVWAFHAAAFGYPGRAYFSVTGLSDTSKPVGIGVLLHPSFICAALAVAFTGCVRRDVSSADRRCVAIGLSCWMVGATFGTLANANVDQVMVTYCSVFLAGAAIYMALARVSLTGRDLEWGVIGLAVGSLFPLIGGLQAFVQEWGIPDATTALGAYQNLIRMELYEAATFGNRGNTAGFIIIVAPLFLWVSLDRSRSRVIRLLCAAVLVPIVLNLVVLQVRAAFLTLLLSLSLVWGFKLGLRRYPLFAITSCLGVVLLVRYSPDIALEMFDRLQPVVTADSEGDVSVGERTESIREGVLIAERNWQFGVGPGGALTRHSRTSAHQFQVQQFMEAGILGLAGSIVFSIGILMMLVRTLSRGQDDGVNNVRFTLLIGPASFVMYGVLANATFNVGYVNTWAILLASMLALTPGLSGSGQPALTGWQPRVSPGPIPASVHGRRS